MEMELENGMPESLADQFNLSRFDKNNEAEAEWEFKQDDWDQGLIVNPELVGKKYEIMGAAKKKKGKKKKTLRRCGFAQHPEHFYYSVRKCSAAPWADKSEHLNGEAVLYTPDHSEKVDKYT